MAWALEELEKSFGPYYNINSTKLSKWRGVAKGRELSLEEKREYGREVLNTVRAAQRAALAREVALPATRCASGCASNKAKDILASVRRAAKNRPDAQDAWKKEPDAGKEWKYRYTKAMGRS